MNEKFDSFDYYISALENEQKILESQGSFLSEFIYVQKAHSILLDFLYTAEEENFYKQLRALRPFLEILSNLNDQFFDRVYPDRMCQRIPIEWNGLTTYVYYNTFNKKRPLTEEERTIFYEEELIRHKSVNLQKILLNREALNTLIPGQTYNFILNLQNVAYIAYEQRYKLRNDPSSKPILNSANHTLLAGNSPVIAAGSIDFYKIGKKELYFLTCTSGHFKPKPDCLDHMKNYLVSLGVPEEAIIKLSVGTKKIDERVNKIIYSQ